MIFTKRLSTVRVGATADMSKCNYLFRMILLFTEDDSPEGTKDHTISVTEVRTRGKREFMVSVENLKTGVVFNSPADNDKILEVMPLEYWPTFARESLLAGKPDEQGTLF